MSPTSRDASRRCGTIPPSGSTTVTDRVGHGTMVAGLIAMVDGNGIGGRGVAGATQVVPIRVTTTGVLLGRRGALDRLGGRSWPARDQPEPRWPRSREPGALARVAYAVSTTRCSSRRRATTAARQRALVPRRTARRPYGGEPGALGRRDAPDGSAASFSTYNQDVSVAAPAPALPTARAACSRRCRAGHGHVRGRPRELRLALRRAGRSGRRPLRVRAGHELLGTDRVGGRVARAAGEPGAARAAGRRRDPAQRAPDARQRLERAHRAGLVDAFAAVTLAPTYDTVAPRSRSARRAGRVGDRLASTASNPTGPGEAPAGPASEAVLISTDDKAFHVLASSVRAAVQSLSLRPGSRIWLRGTACDGLHNCTTRDSGPFHGAPAVPEPAAPALGLPGNVFHLRVGLGSLENSYTAPCGSRPGTATATGFPGAPLPFGGRDGEGARAVHRRYRLRASLLAGPLWHASTSSLVVQVTGPTSARRRA